MLTLDHLYNQSKRASGLIVELVYPKVIEKRRTIIGQLVHQYARPNAIVVDLGAGPGSFCLDEVPWPIRLVSVDRTITQETIVLGDVQQAPLRQGIADVVVAAEVIEHVRDPRRLCAEVSRVLSPRGVCILSTPWLWELIYQPEVQLLVRTTGTRSRTKKGNPKIALSRLLTAIDRGEAHINWHAPQYWRRHLSRIFRQVREVGICFRSRVSYDVQRNTLTAGFLLYLCSQSPSALRPEESIPD